MRLLLDTHVLLWSAEDSGELPVKARALIDDPENELIFSVVSLWEIAIKRTGGHRDFQTDPRVLRRELIETGFIELSITSAHALRVDDLPLIHQDPFDRMLAAQALAEGVTLVTADATLAKYPCAVRLV